MCFNPVMLFYHLETYRPNVIKIVTYCYKVVKHNVDTNRKHNKNVTIYSKRKNKNSCKALTLQLFYFLLNQAGVRRSNVRPSNHSDWNKKRQNRSLEHAGTFRHLHKCQHGKHRWYMYFQRIPDRQASGCCG